MHPWQRVRDPFEIVPYDTNGLESDENTTTIDIVDCNKSYCCCNGKGRKIIVVRTAPCRTELCEMWDEFYQKKIKNTNGQQPYRVWYFLYSAAILFYSILLLLVLWYLLSITRAIEKARQDYRQWHWFWMWWHAPWIDNGALNVVCYK